MWMTLLSLRNSIAILRASLAVVFLGFVALGRLPVDLFPNINLPIINVGTVYTGAGVLDVEKTVTYPIEKAVSAISDVRFVESKSRQGLSTVRVWMNWGGDVNDGQTEVVQRIQQILNTLPRGIKQPFIVRYGPVEHPGGPHHGLGGPPRRAAALRSGLQHHRAPGRAAGRGRVRLRPILMTVLATVVGLLPMALALGVGTEANQPLAIAVIGGLLVSTFFTLLLIPTLYVILEERFPRTITAADENPSLA